MSREHEKLIKISFHDETVVKSDVLHCNKNIQESLRVCCFTNTPVHQGKITEALEHECTSYIKLEIYNIEVIWNPYDFHFIFIHKLPIQLYAILIS